MISSFSPSFACYRVKVQNHIKNYIKHIIHKNKQPMNQQQLTPEEIIQYAKKHPHSHNISTEAFSTDSNKDLVVHNLSMKGDPSNDFDVINYRRGLAFMEDIINFKEENLRVAKKGLRKFYDLLPQYLDTKISHISNSKHYTSIKNKIIDPLKRETESYVIYSTEKANGENAQISWDESGGIWVIGSKNKTLVLSNLAGIKYLVHKHEHVRTISIAEEWFKFLQAHPQQQKLIKQKLAKYTLVGEICDSEKSGHIVDYGPNAKLYFYALVGKQERQYSCESPSHFLQFAKQIGLEQHCVKFNIIQVKTYEALIEQLKSEMTRVYEGELEKYGQGTVIYISTKQNGEENCRSVCKIKTLEYRIYRKLREKLKVYFQKYRKSYDKILNKFIQQVKQLTQGFKTPKPEQYYFNLAKRAFEFCQSQQKAINKFFHNKYISFLKMIQNEKIDKETFKKIVHQNIGNTQIQNVLNDKQKEEREDKDQEKEKKMQTQNQKTFEKETENKDVENKKIAIFIPLTIPAAGKSTVFRAIQKKFKEFYIKILSSDTVRAERMQELMKKQKNLTKKAAYQKTRNSANNHFYKYLGEILKRMQSNKQHNNCILFIDKNHPENALKPTLEQINKSSKNLKNATVKVICILPRCDKLLGEKSKFMYPFSSCYIASCLKRVVSREEHETLEGTQIERANVCINFANMFRNFALSEYNLSKYFNAAITMSFTKEQELPQKITEDIKKVLMGSKPGSFEEHPALEQLIEDIKVWKNEELNIEENIDQIHKQLIELFDNFEGLKVDVSKLDQGSTKAKQ